MRTSSIVVVSSALIAVSIVTVSASVRLETNAAFADTTGSAVIQAPRDTAAALSSKPVPIVLSQDAEPVAVAPRVAAKPAPQKKAVAVKPKPEAAPADTSVHHAPTLGTSAQYPARLLIPSIGIGVDIVPVGLNDKGEMDVPSGATSNVGWYKGGTIPGNVGSAVLDAHVYAAFQELQHVRLGSYVYVQTSGNTKLRFKVVDSRFYTLSELTPAILFGQTDARRLNLITCAGTFVPSINTYDHRLVVFTIFDGEETD